MRRFAETDISRTIIDAYHERLSDRLVSDVLIVGAGPSGMMAAYLMAQKGLKVTLLEKRLAPGGGIWGGGMAMPEVVVQEEATSLLDDVGVRHRPRREGLHTVDAIELAAGLCVKALQAGAVMLNLTEVEDVSVQSGRVTGLVVNRTMIGGVLPVDPIMFSSKAVIDSTGHEAVVVEALRRRGLLPRQSDGQPIGEGPMDATAGEAFVVENVSEVYPGLWVSGMSVCAALGGPRMGPIFGGMLMSGQRVAERILSTLAS